MSYYIYQILYDFKNYEDDENHQGTDLWHSLYDAEGLKSTWRDAFKDWLNELLDMNQIPEGHFRDCWIQDVFYDAKPHEYEGILHDIHHMFEPDEDEEDEIVFEIKSESEETDDEIYEDHKVYIPEYYTLEPCDCMYCG